MSHEKYQGLYSETNIFDGLKIETQKIKTRLVRPVLIPSDVYGVFIDYYIRYITCVKCGIDFIDIRCEEFIYNYNQDNYAIKTRCGINPIEILIMSYLKLKSKDEIGSVSDIFNCSLCHLLIFNRYNEEKYFIMINLTDKLSLSEIENIENIDLYINDKIIDDKEVINNPQFNNEELNTRCDADLIIGDELIDFKCHNYDTGFEPIKYMQLFIYCYCYYKKTNIKLKKLTILNPILGTESYIDISNWDKYDVIYDYINKLNQEAKRKLNEIKLHRKSLY